MSYVVGVVSSILQTIFEGYESIPIQYLPEYREIKQESTDPSTAIMNSG